MHTTRQNEYKLHWLAGYGPRLVQKADNLIKQPLLAPTRGRTYLVSDAGQPDQLVYDVSGDVAEATDVERRRVTRLQTADRRVTARPGG